MDDSKVLLLIPGLIYGVGLVTLLKVFRPKIYWEITVLALLLFLTLIVNWFLFSQKLTTASQHLGIYTLTMLSPLLFTRACNVLTPDEGLLDTKEHFLKIRKPFFLLLGAHTSVNILIQALIVDDGFNLFRYVGIILFFANAFYNKLWLRIIAMLTFAVILGYIFSVIEVT